MLGGILPRLYNPICTPPLSPPLTPLDLDKVEQSDIITHVERTHAVIHRKAHSNVEAAILLKLLPSPQTLSFASLSLSA